MSATILNAPSPWIISKRDDLGFFIGSSWLAFIYAAADVASFNRLVIAVIATNVSHSLQYLRLMWFHNHNRYSERSGFLGAISRKWAYFFAAALVLSIPTQIAEHYNELAYAFTGGLLYFHYTVDAWIWRVRGDVELAKALRLT